MQLVRRGVVGNERGSGRTCDTIVLLSGGMDSSACVAFYVSQGRHVDGLFVDYGQAAAKREHSAAKAIAAHYGVPLRAVSRRGAALHSAGFILGRNAALLTGALMESSPATRTLAIGIHSGSAYSDCGPEFASLMQALFDLYAHGAIQLGAPFLNWSKGDIAAYAAAAGVPLALTYSCERGDARPCDRCLSCLDRRLHAGA